MPDWKQIARQRLATLGLAPGAEADLVDEVAQHLEDLFRELRSGGAGEDAARRQTLAELDDLYPLRASIERNQRMPKHDAVRVGEPSRGSFAEGLWKDLRYALRSMRKNPVFVCFVVLTLALGIGANTTVFTLINTLVLNPVPVNEPGNLVVIASAGPRNAAQSGVTLPVSYADLGITRRATKSSRRSPPSPACARPPGRIAATRRESSPNWSPPATSRPSA